MDSMITAAGLALAKGDPLGALKRVALRDDAPALALRGIAMAQLGDYVRAKALLRSAARKFGLPRRWPAPDAWSQKPRSRSPHGTCARLRRGSTRRAPCSKRMAIR